MKINAEGLKLIMDFEGCLLHAYQDKAGIWTIGYGSTYHANGRPVKKGDRLASKEEALELLKHSVLNYEKPVNAKVKVKLNQNQYNALVSFAFNAGVGNFSSSTLLKVLNAGDYKGAADQLLRWVYITNPKTGEKEVYDVLQLRRRKERLIFLKAA